MKMQNHVVNVNNNLTHYHLPLRISSQPFMSGVQGETPFRVSLFVLLLPFLTAFSLVTLLALSLFFLWALSSFVLFLSSLPLHFLFAFSPFALSSKLPFVLLFPTFRLVLFQVYNVILECLKIHVICVPIRTLIIFVSITFTLGALNNTCFVSCNDLLSCLCSLLRFSSLIFSLIILDIMKLISSIKV